jgi:hypothetical protein
VRFIRMSKWPISFVGAVCQGDAIIFTGRVDRLPEKNSVIS